MERGAGRGPWPLAQGGGDATDLGVVAVHAAELPDLLAQRGIGVLVDQQPTFQPVEVQERPHDRRAGRTPAVAVPDEEGGPRRGGQVAVGQAVDGGGVPVGIAQVDGEIGIDRLRGPVVAEVDPVELRSGQAQAVTGRDPAECCRVPRHAVPPPNAARRALPAWVEEASS